MNDQYDREVDLKGKFNDFLVSDLGLENKNYFDNLNDRGFLKLKSIVNSVNNIITLKATLSFYDKICKNAGVDTIAEKKIRTKILQTKANANGYDLKIETPINLVAEVKCNLPINNGNTYGAAQKTGIIKDLDNLKRGKTKEGDFKPNKSYKFMVLLDIDEVKEATNKLLGSKLYKEKINYPIEIFNFNKDIKTLDKDKIYIAYVSISKEV